MRTILFFALISIGLLRAQTPFEPLVISDLDFVWQHSSIDPTLADTEGLDGRNHFIFNDGLNTEPIFYENKMYIARNTRFDIPDQNGFLVECIDVETGNQEWFQSFDLRDLMRQESAVGLSVDEAGQQLHVFSARRIKDHEDDIGPFQFAIRRQRCQPVERILDLHTGVLIRTNAPDLADSTELFAFDFSFPDGLNMANRDTSYVAYTVSDDLHKVVQSIISTDFSVNQKDSFLAIPPGNIDSALIEIYGVDNSKSSFLDENGDYYSLQYYANTFFPNDKENIFLRRFNQDFDLEWSIFLDTLLMNDEFVQIDKVEDGFIHLDTRSSNSEPKNLLILNAETGQLEKSFDFDTRYVNSCYDKASGEFLIAYGDLDDNALQLAVTSGDTLEQMRTLEFEGNYTASIEQMYKMADGDLLIYWHHGAYNEERDNIARIWHSYTRIDSADLRMPVNNVEVNVSPSLHIHPNPAWSETTVQIHGAKIKRMRMMDLSGRQVLENEGHGQLDLSGVQSGVYFVEVETDRGVFVRKLMVR